MTDTRTTTETASGAGDFTATKSFTSSPDAVAAALQSVDAISAWWGPTTGSAEEGATFRADFGEGRYHEILVTSVDADRVVWTSVAAPHHQGEWEGSTMVFELAPGPGGTTLSFRHAGLTPQLECWDNCSAGWAQVLSSLVSYVDTGTGYPFRLDPQR